MALRSISRLFGSTQTPGCRSVNGTLALSLVLLAVVLVSATSRRSEVVVAVPAAALLVGIGAVPATVAGSEVLTLLPVVAFLGALLVLVAVCDSDGLFRVFGSWLAHSSPGRPRALLGRVFLVAGATTAVLSLDATVLLLTPVVIGTTRLLAVRSRPHTYATVHLANSASLLLPVSNLTNLLAFGATGLSFIRFTVLMAGPWLVAVAVEYVLFRLLFRGDLQDRPATARPAPHESAPLFTLLVLGLTLAGFAVTSVFGVSPAWAAAIGLFATLAIGVLVLRRLTLPLARLARRCSARSRRGRRSPSTSPWTCTSRATRRATWRDAASDCAAAPRTPTGRRTSSSNATWSSTSSRRCSRASTRRCSAGSR